jgi:DNA-binding response OmpR family regulator
MKVLLVEDNQDLNNLIKEFLKLKNFDVDSTIDGDKAKKYIKNIYYDLYIMDINLPNENGLELVRLIREKNINSPIIMMTSLQESEPFVEAFENGCNEYIKKPFHFEELEIRMNNLLKRQTKVNIDENIIFDFKNKELIIDNKTIDLRKKERLFLDILLKSKNDIVTKENIIKYVWENEEKESYPLRQLVSSLKAKIPALKEHIKSISGIGYKFT